MIILGQEYSRTWTCRLRNNSKYILSHGSVTEKSGELKGQLPDVLAGETKVFTWVKCRFISPTGARGVVHCDIEEAEKILNIMASIRNMFKSSANLKVFTKRESFDHMYDGKCDCYPAVDAGN